MTLEELHKTGYECYGFPNAELREIYRRNVAVVFPEAETATPEWEWHGFTVYYLGIKLKIGKARAQAELEGTC